MNFLNKLPKSLCILVKILRRLPVLSDPPLQVKFREGVPHLRLPQRPHFARDYLMLQLCIRTCFVCYYLTRLLSDLKENKKVAGSDWPLIERDTSVEMDLD